MGRKWLSILILFGVLILTFLQVNHISIRAARPDAVTSVAFSPDGKQVLTGNEDGTAKLWEAASGKLISTFTGHKDAVTSVAFSLPTGTQILTGSVDKTAQLWEAATGRNITTLSGHSGAVTSVAFS